MDNTSTRLTLRHEQVLSEAVRVYTNQRVAETGIGYGLSDEGTLLDEAMEIIAAIVGDNLRVPTSDSSHT